MGKKDVGLQDPALEAVEGVRRETLLPLPTLEVTLEGEQLPIHQRVDLIPTQVRRRLNSDYHSKGGSFHWVLSFPPAVPVQATAPAVRLLPPPGADHRRPVVR